MGLSIAFNSALSGLMATSRAAQVASTNIANALTPGYAPRSLTLSATVLGGMGAGVGVNGVGRFVDPGLLGERRMSGAELGLQTGRMDVLQAIAEIFGLSETGDLSDRYQQFENALVAAAAAPDSETRLESVVDMAKALADGLNRASEAVQAQRATADAAIARDVETLNASLRQIRELNEKIAVARTGTDAYLALLDMRQARVDGVSEIVPIRTYDRGNGHLAIVTVAGTTLLEGSEATIGFTKANAVSPDASIGSLLSGLTVNGVPVAAPPGGGFAGGRLAASFEARDVSLPQAQARLDALARDLIERLSGTDADPTLAVGNPGIFTDAGGAFSTASETGLAGRVSVNALIDPEQGGALWRLRDGLGATAAGPVGDPAGLYRLIDVLSEARPPASGDFGTGSYSVSGLFGAASSLAFGALSTAEYDLAFAQGRHEALVQEELTLGVDSDAELQNLILVEQAYAANARVIEIADDMLRRILEI